MKSPIDILDTKREAVIKLIQDHNTDLMNAQNTMHEYRIMINEAQQNLTEIESAIEILKGIRKN